jgi:hypothetical protein
MEHDCHGDKALHRCNASFVELHAEELSFAEIVVSGTFGGLLAGSLAEEYFFARFYIDNATPISVGGIELS